VDLAAAFLLALLGGYCFAYLWRAISFATRRAEGHHLYFRAAICGTIIFSLTLVLRAALIYCSPAYLKLDSTLVEYVRPALKLEPGLLTAERTRRAEWVVTAVYSLLLGIVCGIAANVFTPRWRAWTRGVGDFDRSLLDAYGSGIPLLLTLNTSKVYIGLIVRAPNPVREPTAITILPMFSGSRDTDGRLNLTTDYETVYARLRHGRAAQLGLPADWTSQFKLTIRADEIVTVAPFSPGIHTEFNPDWRHPLAPPSYVLSSIGTNRKFSGPT
jgi:hypothetical protein